VLVPFAILIFAVAALVAYFNRRCKKPAAKFAPMPEPTAPPDENK
jgi:hypothetical protein